MVVLDDEKNTVRIVVPRALDSTEKAQKESNAFVVGRVVGLSFGRMRLTRDCASVSGLSAGSLKATA